MRTEFLCISVLRVASGPRVKLAGCKSAFNGRSGAVVPVLVLLFVPLWFILRGDLLYVFPCVILFLCFSVLLVLRLPRLGKSELILVLFVRLFGLFLFRFVGFLFLLGSGKGCGLWLWHSLDFSLTFFFLFKKFYWSDRLKNCSDLSQIKDTCVRLWKREIVYYANTKDPDQAAHLHILIRISLFINVFYRKRCFFRYTIKDADLSARILRSLS